MVRAMQLGLTHISSTETIKSIYFAQFHSIMKYRIIFWGNSHTSRKILTLQRKIIRIMASVKPRNSCRSMFKRLEILTRLYEYIFSLMNFKVNNQEYFQTHSALHSINTRNVYDHIPAVNLSCFQKSTCYCGIKIFNSLPCSHKHFVNKKVQFKATLKIYLNTQSFYSVGEFLMFKNES
jgi:hypothetical protein